MRPDELAKSAESLMWGDSSTASENKLASLLTIICRERVSCLAMSLMVSRLDYFRSNFFFFLNLFGPKKSYLDLWTNLIESLDFLKSLK